MFFFCFFFKGGFDVRRALKVDEWCRGVKRRKAEQRAGDRPVFWHRGRVRREDGVFFFFFKKNPNVF